MADSQPDLSGDEPRRPSLSRRHSSKTSEVSQSLSEGSGSQRTGPYKPQRHVVGAAHGRLGARNTSFGKNLNKLNKATAAAQDGTQAPKTHNRSKSGDTSLPGSPRPANAVKRNSSTFVIPRNSSHSALKKNYSSGHLPRHGPSKNIMKTARVQTKRTRSGQSDQSPQTQSQPASPDAPEPPQHPVVRFNLGDDELQAPGEDEWTEESASQSPLTSRTQSASHTRSNSVQIHGYVKFPLSPPQTPPCRSAGMLKPKKSVSFGAVSLLLISTATPPSMTKNGRSPGSGASDVLDDEIPSPTTTRRKSFTPGSRIRITDKGIRPADVVPSTTQHPLPTVTRQSPTPQIRTLPDRTRNAISQINGSPSYRPSNAPRVPDADAITSRILQKHNALPQVSNVTASVTPDHHHPPSIPHSQGSTIADGTPGRDLVSRFINGTSGSGSAAGTPNEDSFLSQRSREDKNDIESTKRNKSVPSMNKVEGHRRTSSEQTGGTSTPAELPPSRTQQKLMLQRASSAIEPGKHVPAVLPTRPGAPQLLGGNMPFPFGESVSSAQMQGLFNQTTKEYNVVRRYRNPLAEAVGRLGESSDIRRNHINRPKSSKGAGGSASSSGGSLSQTYRETQSQTTSSVHRQQTHHGHATASSSKKDEGDSAHAHRSRVSFDLPGRPAPQEGEDDEQGSKTESFSSDSGRVRDEAYDICRRMWALDYSGGGVNEG